jgi:ribosomal-protein-alanine N-acetyltransferase
VTLNPTPRLLYRPLAESDFDAVHAYASDPEVTAHLDWGPNDVAATRAFMDRVFAHQVAAEPEAITFVIVERSSGELIGACSLHHLDRTNRSSAMGYTLRRASWGQGYGSEMAAALRDFAFTRCDVHRLWATCRPENVGSARVLERIGMRLEGRLRHAILSHGAWRDTLIYAMLAEDREPLEVR